MGKRKVNHRYYYQYDYLKANISNFFEKVALCIGTSKTDGAFDVKLRFRETF